MQQSQAERAELARQERIAAFNSQKPIHTSALLAGAAATPVAKKGKSKDLRIRDLRTVTGEDGLWVNLNDLEDLEGEEDVEVDGHAEREMYGKKVRQHVVAINRREGWDDHAGEI